HSRPAPRRPAADGERPAAYGLPPTRRGAILRRAVASVVEPQVLGRDGAEDFLGGGLAAGGLEQGGAAEGEEPGARRRLAELAGRPPVGDQPAELAVDPQHLEDAGAPGVAGPETLGASPGAEEAAALAGLEPGADLLERRGRLVQVEGDLAAG